MRNREHPAYHNLSRKLCRLNSLLYNFEQPLRDDGFDYDAQYEWSTRQMCAVTEDAPNDPLLEKEAFDRMDAILKFLFVRVPHHRAYPGYKLYHQLWRECYGEPVRPLSAEDLKPLDEPAAPVIARAIYGVPFEHLDAARLQMGRMKLQKSFPPFLMYLCGLLYAMGYHARHRKLPVHDVDDGLLDIAREALECAVDFANEPGTIEQARQSATDALPEAYQRLYMGVFHMSISHTSGVYEWLHRADFMRDLTSLLFAMGVRSLNDPYAKHLVLPCIESCQHLNEWLPDPAKALLHEFFNQDQP